MPPADLPNITTVTLNPAIDRMIEVAGLRPGDHAVGHTVCRSAGGKGMNISRVLGHMEIEHTATGFLGRDNHHLFAALLASLPVRDEFLRLPGLTRENITLKDTATGVDTHLRDAGLAVTARDIAELTEQLLAGLETGDQLIFSGSLPPGMDPKAFADMVEACIDAGATAIVDTSGPALQAVAHAKLTLIKPNAQELTDLVGKPLPDRDAALKAARGLAQRYGMILLSAGEDGAYLVMRESILHARVTAPPAAVNTVGCGDVLLGRFIGQLNLGTDDDEALADAVATATASAASDTPATWDNSLARHCLDRIEVTEP